jgi:hypothetical protein
MYYGMGVHTHRFYRTHMRSTLISMVLLLPPTTHNTTTTHNNQNERPPPTLWRLLPLCLHGQGRFAPDIIAPLFPYECAQVASRRACAAPVPLFGAPEWHPSKMREVGGASTLMAAVRIKNTTINKKSVSTLGNTSKKRRRWVGTCGEDVIPLFGVEN